MQSVLAIPFGVSPVVEAGGDVAPSTDGAFLQSFADTAPDQAIAGVDTGSIELGIVQGVTFPFALLPAAVVPHGDKGLAMPTGSTCEASDPASPTAGLPAATANGGGLPVATPNVAMSAGEALAKWGTSEIPFAGPKTPIAPADLPGLRAGLGEEILANVADAPGPATGAGTHPGPSGSGVSGEDASPARQPLSDGAGKADPTAGRLGIAARPETASGGSAPLDGRGRAVSPARAKGGAEGVPPPAGMKAPVAPPPAAAEVPKAEDALYQRPDGTRLEPPILPTETLPAETGLKMTGLAASPDADLAEIIVEPLPAITATTPDRAGAEASFDPPGAAFAASWLSGPEWPASRGDAAARALDPADLPGPAKGAGTKEAPVSQAFPSARAAGFWEQLLTGLSTGLPVDPAHGEPAARQDREGDPEVGPDAEAEAEAQAWTVTAPPSPSDRAATSLAHFAKAVALQADATTDPAPEKDMVDQFAAGASALPGLSAQGQALPQLSSAGPAQLPVPQIAAQISAALTQSADGATELALSPEELGNVRLRLEQDAKHPERMVVHITFERPETLDLFRRHAGELAEALRDAGYAGADIGFGQEEGGAGTPDRNQGAAASDYGSARTEAQILDPIPPRLMAGVSLDLRL